MEIPDYLSQFGTILIGSATVLTFLWAAVVVPGRKRAERISNAEVEIETIKVWMQEHKEAHRQSQEKLIHMDKMLAVLLHKQGIEESEYES